VASIRTQTETIVTWVDTLRGIVTMLVSRKETIVFFFEALRGTLNLFATLIEMTFT